MTNLFKLVHNVETGEVEEIALTDEEIANLEIEAIKKQERLEAAEAKAIEKAALLAKLGITADEAKLLLS